MYLVKFIKRTEWNQTSVLLFQYLLHLTSSWIAEVKWKKNNLRDWPKI